MHRFYLDYPLSELSSIALPKNICSHIHVLRLKRGDVVQFFNGDGYNYNANLQFKNRTHIIAQITNKNFPNNESALRISLIQVFSTNQKMDFIIQKAVELGVSEIYPAISSRTNAKFSYTKNENRQRRWHEIIYAACEQSGRSVIPILHPITELTTIFQSITTEYKFILHPISDTVKPVNIPHNTSLAIAIGPEGGLSEQELELAKSYNFISYSLGPRILRTETAPIAALSNLQTQYGDFT